MNVGGCCQDALVHPAIDAVDGHLHGLCGKIREQIAHFQCATDGDDNAAVDSIDGHVVTGAEWGVAPVGEENFFGRDACEGGNSFVV